MLIGGDKFPWVTTYDDVDEGVWPRATWCNGADASISLQRRRAAGSSAGAFRRGRTSTGNIVQACVVLLWMPRAVRKSVSGLNSQRAVLDSEEAYIQALLSKKKKAEHLAPFGVGEWVRVMSCVRRDAGTWLQANHRGCCGAIDGLQAGHRACFGMGERALVTSCERGAAEKSVSGAERWALNRQSDGSGEQEAGGHQKSARDNDNINVLRTFLVASALVLHSRPPSKQSALILQGRGWS
ncbi:hypothetical protein B0H13DRAFT_1894366 [Mycena leptocephala]|nr:hypothetical protein B0H13DRAFT_1894366 [Mycena leptocephala]